MPGSVSGSSRTRLRLTLVAAVACTLLSLHAPSVEAAPPSPEFLAAFAEAKAAHQQQAFAAAYRRLAPFIPEISSFDDGPSKPVYAARAAVITCMGGFESEAKQLVRVTREAIRLSGGVDRDFDEQAGIGGFGLNDMITGGYTTELLGWASARACTVGVSGKGLAKTLTFTSTRSPSVRLTCTFARTCTGHLSVTTPPRGIAQRGEILADARYSIESEQTQRLRLRLTALGRRLLLRQSERLQRSGVTYRVLATGQKLSQATYRPVSLKSARPGDCGTAAGAVSIISKTGVSCAAALAVARHWLDRTGYTPGIDAPPKNGLVLTVDGYRCIYRAAVTDCTKAKKRIRIRVRL